MHPVVAPVAFAMAVCVVFAALTRAVTRLPSHEMDALVIGLAFFLVPCAAVYPVGAPLWAACLYGGWSLGDTALLRRRRSVATLVPDRVPEDWPSA